MGLRSLRSTGLWKRSGQDRCLLACASPSRAGDGSSGGAPSAKPWVPRKPTQAPAPGPSDVGRSDSFRGAGLGGTQVTGLGTSVRQLLRRSAPLVLLCGARHIGVHLGRCRSWQEPDEPEADNDDNGDHENADGHRSRAAAVT